MMENQNRGVRILVVDDDEAGRWGLARLLRRDGFPTEEAADGREALEKLSQREFEIIITDMKMPKLGGLDLLRAIQEGYRGKVIMMTAYGAPESYYKALDFGAFEYIHKPIDYDNLLHIIGDMVGN